MTMANATVQQLVLEQLHHSGALAPSFSQPVAVRLDPGVVSKYDVLARHLGFASRSALMRAVLEGSVEELVELATEAVSVRGDSLNQLDFELENDC